MSQSRTAVKCISVRKGLETCGGSSGLFVVHEIALCKAFGDIAGNVARIIPFPFADKFTPEGGVDRVECQCEARV